MQIYTMVLLGLAQKYSKFQRLNQEVTNTGQKYSFIVNWKKMSHHLIASLLVIFGSILGFFLLFSTSVGFLSRPLSGISLWLVSILVVLLLVLFVIFVFYLIYLIIKIPPLKKLRGFILTLEKGAVSLCEKPLPISEKLMIHITFDDKLPRDPLATARFLFEPLHLSPFSKFIPFEKYLTYHEKRVLAEQLSLNLKIQLTDKFSSFEPGVHTAEQGFAEKPKFDKTEPSDGSKLVAIQNPNVIQLPLFNKKTLFVELLIPLLIVPFVAGLALFIYWLINGRVDNTFYSLLWFIYCFSLGGLILFTIPKFSRDKILVTDDSITLTRRYIWGTRKVFSSHLSKLKDIAIITTNKSARIVFRSDKQTRVTHENSIEVIEEANLAMNNLLTNRP